MQINEGTEPKHMFEKEYITFLEQSFYSNGLKKELTEHKIPYFVIDKPRGDVWFRDYPIQIGDNILIRNKKTPMLLKLIL